MLESGVLRGQIQLGAVALATALGATGCTGSSVDPVVGADGGSGSNRIQLERSLDADDLAFFDPTVLAGALLTPPPRDLAEGVDVSTTVLVAEIVDVRATRVLVGETENDRLEMLGLVLRPAEVVHGQLLNQQNEVVVEFLVAIDRDKAIAAMRPALPQGLAVWFLNEADIGELQVVDDEPAAAAEQYYNVIHLQAGVFVQGSGHVVAGPWQGEPVEPREPGEAVAPEVQSMRTEAASFATLDDLVVHLRTLD